MNQGVLPLMVFSEDCNRVIEQVSRLLLEARFTVVESFDLQEARAGHGGHICPRHGTDPCACQLAILWVYGHESRPATLTIYGDGERTELSIVETWDQTVDPWMKREISSALKPRYFAYNDQEAPARVL